MIDELVKIALLGTHGSLPQLPALPSAIGDVVRTAKPQKPEQQVLDAIAVASLYARCGVRLQTNIAPLETCPADQRPECSHQAGHLLAQILETGPRELLVEWLGLARRARERPPRLLLPRLLEAGAMRRELRESVAEVVDSRGHWLMQFNPRWQFSNSESTPLGDVWQTGNRQQRAEALRAVRSATPALAREFFTSTWKEDAADERAEWLGCMIVGLSADDEPFLESCLDDRSIRVREAAVDLLARLPNSALIQRMVDRLSPLISFHPGTSGSLLKLKRGSKAELDVTLPGEFDKTMQRDAITEKPTETLGPKQWWLLQILSLTPLSFWTTRCAAAAQTIVEAVPDEYAALLVRGWLASLTRRPEPDWIVPLLSRANLDTPLDSHVLKAVPNEMRSQVFELLVRKSPHAVVQLRAMIDAWQPLSEDVSLAMIDRIEIEQLVAMETVYHLHPAACERFERLLSKCPEDSRYKKKIDEALSAIAMRRELHKEFAR